MYLTGASGHRQLVAEKFFRLQSRIARARICHLHPDLVKIKDGKIPGFLSLIQAEHVPKKSNEDESK
jgi:hypothetical protein